MKKSKYVVILALLLVIYVTMIRVHSECSNSFFVQISDVCMVMNFLGSVDYCDLNLNYNDPFNFVSTYSCQFCSQGTIASCKHT